jgi:ankyrin repeat protein
MLTRSQLSEVFDAMRRRDLEVPLHLIESGVIPKDYVFCDEENGIGFRLIDSAIDLGDTFVTQRLIELGANVQKGEHEGVPLVAAAGLQRRDIVEMLLKAGADVNALADCEEETGETALMAAAENKSSEIVRILLAAGADPTRLDGSGQSAMFSASRRGNTETIELLLKAGCPVTGICLHGPVKRRDTSIVKEFLARCTDVNATFPFSTAGETRGDIPLVMVISKNGDEILAGRKPPDQLPRRADRLMVLDALLQAGADVNFKQKVTGKSMLMFAVEQRDPEIAERLIRAGADPRSVDTIGGKRKISPLELAQRTGDQRLVAALGST